MSRPAKKCLLNLIIVVALCGCFVAHAAQQHQAPPLDTINVNNLPVVKDTSFYHRNAKPSQGSNELIVSLLS